MVLEMVLIVTIWVLFVILDICLIGILDGEKLNFNYMINKEFFILITICIFAPIVFLILVLGVAAKIGISIANNISSNSKKYCSKCTYCIHNECVFFKLTIKPKMLCKGKFFSSNQGGSLCQALQM